MQFTRNIYEHVLHGSKTLTTRIRPLRKKNFSFPSVPTPGRGLFGHYFIEHGGLVYRIRHLRTWSQYMLGDSRADAGEIHYELHKAGGVQAKIDIIDVYDSRLQDMSDEEVLREVCETKQEYAALWDSIYGKQRGFTWQDNPIVWRYRFERTKATREIYAKWFARKLELDDYLKAVEHGL